MASNHYNHEQLQATSYSATVIGAEAAPSALAAWPCSAIRDVFTNVQIQHIIWGGGQKGERAKTDTE